MNPEYHVVKIGRSSVDHLIKEGHYLHCWPAIVTGIFGLIESELFVRGVIVFAMPPKQTAKRYGVTTCWELARLFIEDCTPKNTETWFLRRTLRLLKRLHSEVECLVSYADPKHGHTGVIYRAGNWINDGHTDQERMTPRRDYVAKGKKYSRKAHLPLGASYKPIYRSSKFRYVYWLDGSHEKKRQAAYWGLSNGSGQVS